MKEKGLKTDVMGNPTIPGARARKMKETNRQRRQQMKETTGPQFKHTFN